MEGQTRIAKFLAQIQHPRFTAGTPAQMAENAAYWERKRDNF
jgi:hypothetical protein